MILLPINVSGRFRLVGRRPAGARLIAPWQSNLITDIGLGMIASTNTYLDCCQVGRSGVAPTIANTALLDPIAGTANRTAANSAAANAAPWRGFSQITYTFAAGSIGDAIREICVGPSAALGGPIFSRLIVRNALGKAVAVRVFDDEALDVEYELSCHAPPSDVTGTVVIDGVVRDYTVRAALASTAQHWAPYLSGNFASAGQAVQANFASAGGAHATAHDGAIGAITGVPGGASSNVYNIGNVSYEAGSLRRLANFNWGLNAANFDTGIRSVMLRMAPGSGAGGNSLGAYQVELNPPVMKMPNLGFQFRAGIAWGRA